MNSDELKVKANYDFSGSVKLAEWKKVSRQHKLIAEWAWWGGTMETEESWLAPRRPETREPDWVICLWQFTT